MAVPYLIKRILRSFVFTKHFTIKRFTNLIHVFYLHYFSKNPHVSAYPIRLVIDPGNICTLKCPLCPTGYGKNTRKKSAMKFEDFRRIIDEIKDYVYEVDLYNWGEPFLIKDIFEMAEYAEKANIKVHLNSNLNVYMNNVGERLVKSGAEHLTVSIDGACQETYEKYKRGGNFELVMKNLKEIINAKKKLKSRYPKITWQFLVMKHNEHEIEKAKKIADEIGVNEINFRPVRCDTGSEVTMTDKEKVETSEPWLPTQEKYSRYDYRNKKRKNKLKSCMFLKTTMTINGDGSVAPCCGVYDEKFDFGNVFKEGVMGVWNNEKYKKARMIISKRDSSDKSIVCSYCIENGFLEY